MPRKTSEQYNGRRYSVRASITLWMVLAGFVWVTLGLILTFTTHWGENSIEAEADRLSKIAPAAGPGAAPGSKQIEKPGTFGSSQ